jgi:hypothetical protein
MGSLPPLLLNSFVFFTYNSIDAIEPMNRLNNRCIMQQMVTGKDVKVEGSEESVTGKDASVEESSDIVAGSEAEAETEV